MSLYNKYGAEALAVAKANGFEFSTEAEPELINGIVGEISEALRHLRDRGDEAWLIFNSGALLPHEDYHSRYADTVEMEMTDTWLRIASLRAWRNRPPTYTPTYTYNDAAGIQRFCYVLTGIVCNGGLDSATEYIEAWARATGTPLEQLINIKMEHNKTRGHLHGHGQKGVQNEL